MTKFTVSVTSDTVCPWCYVGKKKLEGGIAAYKAANPSSDDTFSVSWLPFQLNPAAPSPGIDKQRFYEEKFGSHVKIDAIHERLDSIGKPLGINFKWGGKIGNTRDSHRLIQLAKTKGEDVQDRVVNELFASYFENEKDIADLEVLVDAGVKAGLEPAEVKAWLKSGKGGTEVDAELRSAQASFITGVPHFVIQGKYEVQGAQDAEGFRRIFEKVKALEE